MAVDLKTMNYGTLDVEARNVGTPAAHDDTSMSEAIGAPHAAVIDTALQQLPAAQNDSVGRAVAQGADVHALVTTAPELPAVQGAKASLGQTLAVTNNLEVLQTFVSQPLSAAMIFDLLQRAAQQAYEMAGTFNRIANRSNIDAKTSEAAHLMQQVEGERTHATTALTGAVLGAAAGAYVGMKGASMARSDAGAAVTPPPHANAPAAPVPPAPAAQAAVPPAGAAQAPAPAAAANGRRAAQPGRHDAAAPGQAADPAAPAQPAHPEPARDAADSPTAQDLARRDRGNGISNMGQPISAVVTTGFDTYDKISANGGQYQADQARIAQKNDTVDSAIAQTVVDTSKSSLDQATEGVKAAQQAIQSWAERQAQVTNNIANR